MQETCVEFIKGEPTLSWYSSDSKWIARMVQLANVLSGDGWRE